MSKGKQISNNYKTTTMPINFKKLKSQIHSFRPERVIKVTFS